MREIGGHSRKLTCDNKNEVDGEAIMTREDVKKLFPEASDEAVTELLNKTNSEVAREKGKADKYKADMEKLKSDAEEVEGLRAKVEELENEKLTEEERQQKAKEAVENELSEKMVAIEKDNAELRAQLNSERIRAYAGSKSLNGEHIDNILKSFGGDYDSAVTAIDSMAQLISDREAAAATARELEIAKASGNPSGQGAGGDGGNSAAINRTIASAKRAASANENILKNYRR